MSRGMLRRVDRLGKTTDRLVAARDARTNLPSLAAALAVPDSGRIAAVLTTLTAAHLLDRYCQGCTDDAHTDGPGLRLLRAVEWSPEVPWMSCTACGVALPQTEHAGSV